MGGSKCKDNPMGSSNKKTGKVGGYGQSSQREACLDGLY